MKIAKIIIVAFLMIGTLNGCGKKAGKRLSETPPLPSQTLPEYSLEDVTHLHYDSGILKCKVDFSRGFFFRGIGELHVENCIFVYYDSYGAIISRGRSKRATLFKNKSQLVAENDVVVVSEVNGGVLTTDYLEWRGDDSQFTTDSFVTITRENGDILQGIGMVTDVALRYVHIKKDVRGKFRTE